MRTAALRTGETDLRAGPRTTRGRARLASWVLLVVVAAIALSIGSRHEVSSQAARISYLESVIKCPPCSGLSIGQSEVPEAKALRASVQRWVAAGWSDARIEARVVSLYGSNELLRPQNPLVWILPIAVLAAGLGGLGTFFWRRRQQSAAGAVSDVDEALVRAARAAREP